MTGEGTIEEEGNLGRTDLLLAAGLGRPVPPAGFLGLQVRIPIRTWAHGEQVKYPLLVSLAWSR